MWSNKSRNEKCLIIFITVTTLIAIGAIIGIIVLATQSHQCVCQKQQALNDPYVDGKVGQNFTMAEMIRDKMMNEIVAENIRQNLLNLTKDYHPAGSDANMAAMDFVAASWRSYGLDSVQEDSYEILLSYPDFSNPNLVFVQEGTDWKLLSNGLSTVVGPPEAQVQQHDNASKLWWNAYSPPGDVNGSVVYVNYCTQNDFKVIDSLNIDLKDKIILCRYGMVFRADMTLQAENNGAAGVILYLDPADYGPPLGEPSTFVFPESIYAPPTAAQRGTMFVESYGDPQTPLYPSKNYTYRWYTEPDLRTNNIIPSIPVTPIGYAEAQYIFGNMTGGIPVPKNSSFYGGLNVTYYYNTSVKFRLVVNSETVRKPIKNVIGYIWGRDEPDRYVLLSNHVDAWTYGAQDPNSGTAVHLEVSRALKAVMNQTGWRPRRTVVFCAWDAEEYGLGGSAEWVQEKLKILESRAVAVINVDVGVSGNVTLSVESAPLLYRAMINASQFVMNPNPDERSANRKTTYDSWLYYNNQSLLPNDPTVPFMALPAGGSDHEQFIMYAGVPVVDFGYSASTPGDYPLYHSMYEIEWTVENLVDINFTASVAVARVWGEVIRNLADSLIIPFNLTDYGVMMTTFVDQLNGYLANQTNISQIIDNFPLVTSNLTDAAQRFLSTSINFQRYVDDANSGRLLTVVEIEALNERLSNLEKAFIDPRGIPDHPQNRHVVFSPSQYNVYSGSVFSGVIDSLQTYYMTADTTQKEKWRKTVNLQLTAVQYCIESAILVLNDDRKPMSSPGAKF